MSSNNNNNNVNNLYVNDVPTDLQKPEQIIAQCIEKVIVMPKGQQRKIRFQGWNACIFFMGVMLLSMCY